MERSGKCITRGSLAGRIKEVEKRARELRALSRSSGLSRAKASIRHRVKQLFHSRSACFPACTVHIFFPCLRSFTGVPAAKCQWRTGRLMATNGRVIRPRISRWIRFASRRSKSRRARLRAAATKLRFVTIRLTRSHQARSTRRCLCNGHKLRRCAAPRRAMPRGSFNRVGNAPRAGSTHIL